MQDQVSKCKSKKKLDDNFNEALELVKPAFQERKAVLSQWKTERRSKLDLVISCWFYCSSFVLINTFLFI